MSFRLSHNLKISPFDYDNVDWYEFLWQFERLSREIEQINQEQQHSGQNNQLNDMINGNIRK
jgi:hypothetical protein